MAASPGQVAAARCQNRRRADSRQRSLHSDEERQVRWPTAVRTSAPALLCQQRHTVCTVADGASGFCDEAYASIHGKERERERKRTVLNVGKRRDDPPRE
jgi:hypothetical protein